MAKESLKAHNAKTRFPYSINMLLQEYVALLVPRHWYPVFKHEVPSPEGIVSDQEPWVLDGSRKAKISIEFLVHGSDISDTVRYWHTRVHKKSPDVSFSFTPMAI